MGHTIEGSHIDADDPLAVAVISGGATAHTIDGNLIDEDNPLAVAVVSGGGSMTAPEIAAAGGLAVVAYKSADETVNNSDVLQDDDALFFAVGANEVWAYEMILLIESVNVGHSFGWTAPVGASMAWGGADDIASWGNNHGQSTAQRLTLSEHATWGNSGTVFLINIRGLYFGGAAGALQFQWCQDIETGADASDNKVLAGSHILAARLA